MAIPLLKPNAYTVPQLTSIVSYPERGEWGDNKWRGNCSGQLIKDLLLWFNSIKPISTAYDPMVGSGTFIDVCNELGINHFATDLNPKYGGWDALNDEVPGSSDFIFWHPPYGKMIPYSGNIWGDKPDSRDLSHMDWSNFIKALDKIQAKLLSSLRKGGRLAILVGDWKQKGVLYSMQKDMAWLGTPEQIIIKVQHNADSYKTRYTGKFIPITHEYVLIFRRDDAYLVPVKIVKSIDFDLRKSEKQTWRDVIHAALEQLGGKATLEQLYQEVKDHAKCLANPNWEAKIRQTLQRYTDFVSLNRGLWSFSY